MKLFNEYTDTTIEVKSDRLPDKPSKLLRLAVKDLELIEDDPDYVVEMNGLWHETDDQGKCWVCFAGALMAKSIHCPKAYFTPGAFPRDVTKKLLALDRFRLGDMLTGLYELGYRPKPKTIRRILTTDYHSDPDQFKADMLTLADYLEKEGL